MNQALKRLSQPMAVEPQTLRVMAAIASRGRLEAAALAEAKAAWDARRAAEPRAEEQGGAVEGTGGTLRIINGVGVLSIEGALFRHADMFTDISGGTSYNAIWRGLEAALSSPAVKAILLRVNSPGGEVDGLNELAEGIAAAGDNKTVWAFADNMCASAAYWLASQAQRIVAEPTSEIGSIGVRCGLLDDAKADEMAGLREIEIISSASPGKRSRPVDDEVISRVQSRIDDLAQLFVEAVARGRGVDGATVMADFGQGDVMIAGKAAAAGMVDAVGDFNSTLAALSGSAATGAAAATARPNRGTMSHNSDPAPQAGAPRAEEEQEPQLRCAKCQGECGKTVYCPSCYDDHDEPDGDEDEEAKALAAAGLLGQTKSATRGKLVEFARSVLEATGASSGAAALARVVDNATCAANLGELRAQVEKERASLRSDVVSKGLAAAIASGRVTIGRACKEVPLMLGASKAAARAALEEIPVTLPQSDEDKAAGKKPQAGWTAQNVVQALSSVPITAEAAESIAEWLEAQSTTALPPPAAMVPAGHPAANEAMNAARPTAAGQIPDVSFAEEARRMRAERNESR